MKRQLEIIIKCIDKASLWAIVISAFSIVAIMADEVINAIGRKFAAPLPCALEAAVSLMIPCIFLAAPLVASQEQHTYVTMVTRKLSPFVKRLMDLFGSLLGATVFGVISYGSWLTAYGSILRLEMRIGVFRFPIWPFRIIFVLGLTLLTLQLVVNSLRCLIQMREGDYPEETL